MAQACRTTRNIETHSSGPLQRMKSITVHRGHLLGLTSTFSPFQWPAGVEL
jgi:hypothetical protein